MISALLTCLILFPKQQPHCDVETVEEIFSRLAEEKPHRFTFLNHVDQRIVVSSILPATKVNLGDLCLALSLKFRKDEATKSIIVSPISSGTIESDIRDSLQKFVDVSKQFLSYEPKRMVEESERVKKVLESMRETKQTDDDQFRRLSYLQSCYSENYDSLTASVTYSINDNLETISTKLASDGSYLFSLSPSGQKEINRYLEGNGMFYSHLWNVNLINQYSKKPGEELQDYQRKTIDPDIRYALELKKRNLEWFIYAKVRQVPEGPDGSAVEFQLIPVASRDNQIADFEPRGLNVPLFQHVREIPNASIVKPLPNGALKTAPAIGSQPYLFPCEIFPTATVADKSFAFYFDSFRSTRQIPPTIGEYLTANKECLTLGQTDKWLVMSERIAPSTPQFHAGLPLINFLKLVSEDGMSLQRWIEITGKTEDKDALQVFESCDTLFSNSPNPAQLDSFSNYANGLVLTKLLNHVRGGASLANLTASESHSFQELDANGKDIVRRIIRHIKVWGTYPSVLHSSNVSNLQKISFGVGVVKSNKSKSAELWLTYPLASGDTAKLNSRIIFRD